MDLILASTSKFRQQILRDVGVSFRVEKPLLDEAKIGGENPKKVAEKRAYEKAFDVSARNAGALVLGCDQTVGFEGRLKGKVSHEDEAFATLKELSGKTHFLHSAVSLISTDEKGFVAINKTFCVDIPMQLRNLSDAEIHTYVKTGEWQGCAGCYQVEHRGIHLMQSIGGDLWSIIGLPLIPLLEELRQLGFDYLRGKK